MVILLMFATELKGKGELFISTYRAPIAVATTGQAGYSVSASTQRMRHLYIGVQIRLFPLSLRSGKSQDTLITLTLLLGQSTFLRSNHA
jgi:hypothetical protein